jgi:MOSC domain-containing protein YiiM
MCHACVAMLHRTADVLEAALALIRAAPRDVGVVELIARRPQHGVREILDEATLDPAAGLVGDNWIHRPCRHTTDGSPDHERQITLIGARACRAFAGDDPAAWALAGDQLYVELDLSSANLPAGARLAIGEAIVVVTAPPHTGCAKFSARFGSDAIRWANSPDGRALNLRGIHGRVERGGTVRRGDRIAKLA